MPGGSPGVVISLPLVPSGGLVSVMARSEPALAGVMVGLAMAVAAVLAERRPSADAAGVTAGVSADLVAGVGAGVLAPAKGAPPRRCHGGPQHGALASWLARACSVCSLGCAGTARFGLEHGNRQPAPFSAVRAVRAVRPASIPATRWRKAAASSQAWGVGRRHGQRLARCGELSGLECRAEQTVVANALEAVRQDMLRRSRLAIRRPASFEKRQSC